MKKSTLTFGTSSRLLSSTRTMASMLHSARQRRYLNHSRTAPNCKQRQAVLPDGSRPAIYFTTTRYVDVNEQLTFDYLSGQCDPQLEAKYPWLCD
ncbi:hypothetical protein BOX15_Mlig014918g1 [Macrostomum lignano]|uniref:SET domain-containing protein n=1 Tax=Macrostomum lignano TaxID=282301 RepID=A0A267FIB4_9PLAT|nr:hypothetical protein BOX15_Mlig014918g2 [Macrostomum lignano]PAA73535.1 hypothetical protein BOX15_Mlig014918g1 [Macrostomum lignano]